MNFSIVSYIAPLIILAVILLVISFRNSRFIINPASALVIIWITLIFFHGLSAFIQLVPLYPASFTANLIVACGVAAFSIAYHISLRLFSRQHSVNDNKGTRGVIVLKEISENSHRTKFIDWLIVIYSIGVLILMYQTATGIVGSSSVFSQLQFLRSRLNYDDADWGVVVYASLSVTVAAIYMGANNVGLGFKKNIPTFIVLFVAIVISILSSQRTSLLFLMIGFFFARSRTGIPSLRTISVALLFFIAMFVFIGVLVGKVGSSEDSLIYNAYEGWNSFLLYLLTPLSAFDYSEAWRISGDSANITTRFIFKFLQVIGVYQGQVSSLVMGYVDVPIATNVYTFLHAPVLDYGYFFWLYFVIVVIIYGFVFSFSRISPLERSIQGMMYYPIIVSIFQDQMFVIFSQWFQIFVFTFTLRFVYRRFGGVRLSASRSPAHV